MARQISIRFVLLVFLALSPIFAIGGNAYRDSHRRQTAIANHKAEIDNLLIGFSRIENESDSAKRFLLECRNYDPSSVSKTECKIPQSQNRVLAFQVNCQTVPGLNQLLIVLLNRDNALLDFEFRQTSNRLGRFELSTETFDSSLAIMLKFEPNKAFCWKAPSIVPALITASAGQATLWRRLHNQTPD